MTEKNTKTFKKIALAILSAAFWVAVWWVISLAVANEVLLPSPPVVAKALIRIASGGTFYLSVAVTFLRIAAGFAAGVIFGTLSGALSYKSKTFFSLITPLDALVKATPVASFIILALVWLTRGTIPSFTSFLIVTPIISAGVRSSLLSTDNKVIEAMKVFRLPLFKRIKFVWIPSLRVKYVSSLVTALGLAWKAGIAAEVLCTPKFSVGKALYETKLYLQTDELFAWTLCVIIISLLLEKLISAILGARKEEAK